MSASTRVFTIKNIEISNTQSKFLKIRYINSIKHRSTNSVTKTLTIDEIIQTKINLLLVIPSFFRNHLPIIIKTIGWIRIYNIINLIYRLHILSQFNYNIKRAKKQE